MPSRLANKVAIITGSSSGIGRSIGLHYAAEGALVVCADLQPDPSLANNSNPNAEETEHETQLPTHTLITQRGGSSIFQPVDVRSAASVEALVAAAVSAYGRLDIMVTNAGVGVPEPRPIWECETEAWERVLDVNLKGVFLGIKYACRQMLRQEPLEGADGEGDRGWIINAASILGFMGQTGVGEYCASKSAVMNLTRSAALDCAPHRIHVNAFAPGYTGTAMTLPFFEDEATRNKLQEMHPFRGLGRPQDLARVCVFLASEDAGWVTGTTIPVDGGFLAGRF